MRTRLFHAAGSVVILLASAAGASAQVAGPTDAQSLAALRQLALREITLNHQGNLDFDPDVQASARALKRWYELDPQTGREAILREITSPAPRFGADTLGILPDQILPSEQHILAEHYVSALPGVPALPPRPTRAEWTAHIRRYDALAGQAAAEKHLASLLFRYAGADVIPEVLPTLQERSAKPNCFAQDYMLAFFLKVAPEQASPLLRTAVLNRPPGYTPCVDGMYTRIGNLIVNPVLERFAIEALDDSDRSVATDALYYLRDHGSAQAEQPVFDRLVGWNTQWRDRVVDLIGLPGQFGGDDFNMGRANPNQSEVSFGFQLAQTLAHGHGWLTTEARIRQLLSLTLEPGAKGDLTAALHQLELPPIHIYFFGDGGPAMFTVAQYQLASLDDLKNKLTQYPPGITFVWSDHRYPRTSDPSGSRDLAAWSATMGIHIQGLE